jgi:hypothetical protein
MTVKTFLDFPLHFGAHVIVDTRSGAIDYVSDTQSSMAALALHLMTLGPDEVDQMGLRDEMMEALEGELMSVILGPQKRTELLDVVNIGPFETTGGILSAKNMNYCVRRFSQIMTGEDSVITDMDHEAGRWLKDHFQKGLVRHNERKAKEEEEGSGDHVADMLARLFGASGAQVFRM